MAPRSWGLALAAVGAAATAAVAAQRPAKHAARVYVGRPMRAVSLDVDLRDLPVVPEWQPGDPIKDIPRRRHLPQIVPPEITRRTPDPLLERQALPPLPNPREFETPILNFDAQNYTGVNPPDTVGDVGPDHYVQAINRIGGSSVAVHDKTTGTILAGPFLMSSLGAPAPCDAGRGDPVVLYDGLADRWLLAEIALGVNGVCIYVSRTPDPVSGGWWSYFLSTPILPDYMKFGVWSDAYYMGSNESSTAPPAYALDRARMLDGETARPPQRVTASGLPAFGFELITPADLDGPEPPPIGAPGLFGRHRDDESHDPPGTPGDPIELWAFHVDFDTPANSTFTQLPNAVLSDFSSEMCGLSSFNCIPQPGTTFRLDPLTEMIMFRFVYRNFGTHETLLGQLTVDADGEPDSPADLERTGPRWFELRRTAGPGFTVFGEGTHSPDQSPRWMAGIAMDGDGNVALGYNVSNDNPPLFPSLRYAGRLATDPPGTMRAEVALADGAAFNASIRYGDYSGMAIDPSDDCTFWFTGMYNPVNDPPNRWRTRIASFKFDGCNTVPANVAVFEPPLQAPACMAAGRSCTSGLLLAGRDTILGGPEPNQPNTIAGSCPDGTAGRFHVRESIDRVKVLTLDASQMAPGKTVRVDVTVWGFSPGLADALDLYYTATAATPDWIHLGTVRTTRPGAQTLSMTYTLPSGALQAVRARYRHRGEQTPCGPGDFNDHDDLVFVVQ